MKPRRTATSNYAAPPVFKATAFLRGLVRRRSQATRVRYVSKEVWAFVLAVHRHRLNRSVPSTEYDAAREYGWGIEYQSYDPRVRAANLLRVLAEAVVALPPGTPVSLRSAVPADFGRSKAVAAYRDVHGPAEGISLPIEWRGIFDENLGVLDHGAVVTP